MSPRVGLLGMAALSTLLLACALSPHRRPEGVEFELVSTSPPVDQPMSRDTHFVARLRYRLPESSSETYLVSSLFNTVTPGKTVAGSEEGFLEVSGTSGQVDVSVDLARLLEDPEVLKPLRVRFYLLRRTIEHQSLAIASTKPINLSVLER